MDSIRKSIFLVLALLAAGVLTIAVANYLAEPPARVVAPPLAVHVTTASIERGEVIEQLRGFGLSRPARRANVAAQVAGTITKIPDGLREGTAVKAGQILAEIDPVKYTTELARRRASLTETEEQLNSATAESREVESKRKLVEADLELARNDLRRTRELYEGQAVGERELDTALGAVKLVEQRLSDVQRQAVTLQALIQRMNAQVEMRKQEINSAGVDVERSKIVAPFEGVIEERFVDEGDLMAPGTRLFTIVDLDDIELPIEIPASQASALQVGAVAMLKSDEQPPRTTEGTVVRVSPTINPANRTVSAWIRVDNNSAGIVPGTFLTATISGRRFDDVFPVIREAIVDGGIYVERDGKSVRMEPEFFVYLDELALTRDDLGSEKVVLITSGFERLYDGAPVETDSEHLKNAAADSVAQESNSDANVAQ